MHWQRKKFPGSGIIFIIFVAAMALPKQVILIPLLKFITELGWIDTYKALVLPAVGWPFGVFSDEAVFPFCSE